LIEFQRASKKYPGPSGTDVIAVRELTLRVEEGETLCLIGTSGSGKTTALKMINRLIEPTSGAILVDGKDVQAVDAIELRRKIGYVLQKGGLFPHMTVARNVGLLAHLTGWKSSAITSRVHELLEMVNLPHAQYADRYPHELSGGQRQRVGVARALLLDPPYILMDEPFGALDPITRSEIHREFLQLQKQVKKTIVVVTHDLEEAFLLGHRIALLHGGELMQVGTEQELRKQPASEFVERFLSSHLHKGAKA
jgi:osmoprotectant transport system ATP-binding protein